MTKIPKTYPFPLIGNVIASRRCPLPFREDTVIHDVADLRKFEHSSGMPKVIIHDRKVVGGIGWAQNASVCVWNRTLATMDYDDLTETELDAYCVEIKRLAAVDKWSEQMMAIELQFLKNTLSVGLPPRLPPPHKIPTRIPAAMRKHMKASLRRQMKASSAR